MKGWRDEGLSKWQSKMCGMWASATVLQQRCWLPQGWLPQCWLPSPNGSGPEGGVFAEFRASFLTLVFFAGLLWQILPWRRGQIFQLGFGHAVEHVLGCADKIALCLLPALGGERRSGGFLLGF